MMDVSGAASRHDAYAAEYDRQMQEYACYLPEVLFGLCFADLQPGQRLLEAGIGSGLAGGLFAKAGLSVYGFDFSPAMLAVCRAKGFAVELKQHDLLEIPWPYPAESFDHLLCCGVFHFLAELNGIFQEAGRVLRTGGLFAFTIKEPPTDFDPQQPYLRKNVDGLEVFEHTAGYVREAIGQAGFQEYKAIRCCVGQDLFSACIVQKGDL